MRRGKNWSDRRAKLLERRVNKVFHLNTSIESGKKERLCREMLTLEITFEPRHRRKRNLAGGHRPDIRRILKEGGG